MEKNYNEIKQNLINHFFIKYYKNSICSNKNLIISNMQDRCPFEIEKINDNSIKVILGNGISLNFNFTWEEKMKIKEKGINHLVQHPYYKLISIY